MSGSEVGHKWEGRRDGTSIWGDEYGEGPQVERAWYIEELRESQQRGEWHEIG